MSQLDDLFRKKLQERGVPFEDVYWQQAEQMIARRTQQRRRRFWLWLAGMLFLVLSCGGIAFMVFFYNSPRPALGAFPIPTVLPLPQPGELEGLPPGSTADSAPDDESRELNAATANHSRQASASIASAHNTSRPADILPPTSTLPETSTSGPVVEKGVAPGSADTLLATSLLEEGKKTILELAPDQEKRTAITGTDQTLASEPFTALSLISSYLELPRRPLDLIPTLQVESIRRPRRWHWQASMAMMLNPEDGQSFTSFSGGLGAHYRAGINWGLEGGLQYRIRRGSFGISDESEIVRYGFGRTVTRYALAPSQLHYLEAPLLLVWQHRRHNWRAGASWNYLLGVRGELTNAQKESFSSTFAPAAVGQSGWLEETGFRKHSVSILAGYSYRLLPCLAIGAGVQYTPAGVLSNQPMEAGDPPILKESGPLMLELGLKYTL